MIDNNTYNNINLEKAYKNLKRFTIVTPLEALLPTILIIDPEFNIYWKALESILYIVPILAILSYNYSKDELTYKMSKHNDLRYKKILRYRLKYFLIPAIIYFVMSPLIFIITKNIIYFIIYEVSGFIIFILYDIIINKKIKK